MDTKLWNCKKEVFEKSVSSYPGNFKTVDEYAGALRSWMQSSYQLQCISASFPYYLASAQFQSNPTPSSTSAATNTARPSPATPAAPPQRAPFAREHSVPTIWRRLAAECLDFMLLFFIKLGCTYLAMDFMDIDILQQVGDYDLETLSNYLMTDYQVALSMTSEILLLELVHRIGTCLVEAFCISSGPGGLGGSTPGKRLMGLRVVRCEWTAQSTNHRVLVFPGSNLGFGRALLRSIVKTFSLTFLFPICFTLFSFQHNRTIYDMFSGSMVVDAVTRTNVQR